MSIDLKPCPFCGGTAAYSGVTPTKGGLRVLILCGSCGARMLGPDDDPKRARRAWNRRVERTCRDAFDERRGANAAYREFFHCSECDAELYIGDFSGGLDDVCGNSLYGSEVRFCLLCGARVVHGDE